MIKSKLNKNVYKDMGVFVHVIDNTDNYPTEQMIIELFELNNRRYATNYILKKIRDIKLGRIEKRLCPIRRLTLVNLWRYLTHKTMDIKL